MHPSTFDRLARIVSSPSRRGLLKALIFAATAIRLTPVRIARAELQDVVVLGGECSTSTECQQQDMQAEAICADNGFTSDGELNCCVESGCCVGDADCCGDLRCAPTGDVCSVCRLPPFPTRTIGQVCASVRECIPSVVCTVECRDDQCLCAGQPAPDPAASHPEIPPIPDSETALGAAQNLSFLETSGQLDGLYDLLHPDAKAIVPRAAVVGWYEAESPARGASVAEVVKVRMIPWTWQVNGRMYPQTAEVAFRQILADGTMLRDEVRLVKDSRGEWGWFFGRDRDFVEEQLARFGKDS
jgi:hypothetical protein